MAKDRVSTQAKIQVAIKKIMMEQGEWIDDYTAMHMAEASMTVYSAVDKIRKRGEE